MSLCQLVGAIGELCGLIDLIVQRTIDVFLVSVMNVLCEHERVSRTAQMRAPIARKVVLSRIVFLTYGDAAEKVGLYNEYASKRPIHNVYQLTSR